MSDYFLILITCSRFPCLEHIFLKKKESKCLKSDHLTHNCYLYILDSNWIFLLLSGIFEK